MFRVYAPNADGVSVIGDFNGWEDWYLNRTGDGKFWELFIDGAKPGHMYSYITPVFICDTCKKEAEKALAKCRIYKSFHFSLHGWMDHHTALVELSTGQIDANPGGRHTAKFLKKVLYSSRMKGDK